MRRILWGKRVLFACMLVAMLVLLNGCGHVDPRITELDDQIAQAQTALGRAEAAVGNAQQDVNAAKARWDQSAFAGLSTLERKPQFDALTSAQQSLIEKQKVVVTATETLEALKAKRKALEKP